MQVHVKNEIDPGDISGMRTTRVGNCPAFKMERETMTIRTTEIQRVVLVRLNPGDDVLLALREAVEQQGIKNGIILNGLGSTSSYHYHVVASTELPPKELFPKADNAPRDIVCYSGMIMDGRVHAHILLSDDQRAEGGHLEEGTRVLTFSVVAIADLGDVDVAGWDRVGKM